MSEFVSVMLGVIVPVLLMVAAGAVLRRRFQLDLATLTKLNLYVLTPAFIFDRVAHSNLSWSDMGGIVVVTVLLVASLGLGIWLAGRQLAVSRPTLSAVALAVMFYNSGNVGLPVAELAFPGTSDRLSGGVPQAFVVLTQNVLCFTVGLLIGSHAVQASVRSSLKRILALPVLYTLFGAICVKWWLGADPEHAIPTWFSAPIKYLAGGLIPVALILLGAQLAGRPRWPRWRAVSVVILLRLMIAPTLMLVMLWGMHRLWPGSMLDLWPWPAQLLVLTAGVPSAVNTLVLTMELEGDSDLQADCIFWTTLLSAITLSGWIVIVRLIGGTAS